MLSRRRGQDGADDLVVDFDQILQGGPISDLDRQSSEIVEQSSDECVAHDQARPTPEAEPVPRLPGEQADSVLEVAPRAKRLHQGWNIVLADHHAAEDHEFATGRTNAREVDAELSAVE